MSLLRSKTLVKLFASILASIALFSMTMNSYAAAHSSKTHIINIIDFKFVPAQVEVREGDIVVWVNKDSAPHNIVDLDNGKEISPTLAAGEKFTYKATGAMDYKCGFHPKMRGVLESNY